MSDLINYELEFVEDRVLVSSCLNLSESDLNVLNSIASVYGCTVGDVISRAVRTHIDAYNFVHERLKLLFVLNEKADGSLSGNLIYPTN